MKKSKTRRLAAIMFTDIVGYTVLMQNDENKAVKVRAHHRQAFTQNHEIYNGEIVQYFGDGTLSIFKSGVEAVECAIEIQKALQVGEQVPLRIGLHIGDIVFDGTDIYGDGVNVTSRIESMGVAGSILLSGKLNEELKNQRHLSTEPLGHFEFKNVEQPMALFAVSNEGINVPAPAELQGKGKQQEQTKTIAVLPFVNRSTNAENEYFSDGMTEEIINALSKIKQLKVTSRTSSFFFKNKNIPIAQIGKELNVSTILEGSIRLAGNKMRITAQLIDVTDDFHFWSESFDRLITDVFAVQDEISLLIADKLREHLGHFDIGDQLVEKPDISVDIYQRYLESRYHLLKMTKPDIEKGISILETIIAEQPNFALAYLGMHLGYILLGMMGLMPTEEAFGKSGPCLQKAIELNPNLPECQYNLSYVEFIQNWNFPAGYQHLSQSFEIRPTVEYYQSMVSMLTAEGKFEAARNYIETALQIDPFSEINHHLQGFIYYGQEQYVAAIKCFEKAAQLKPSFLPTVYYRGQALLLLGRTEKSLEVFQQLPADESGDVTKLGFMTLAYAALGNKKKTEKGIEKLEAALETPMLSRAISALILCQTILGNEEAAIQMVEKGVAARLPMMVYLYTEPILKSLRSNPRFQELVRQILGEETPFDFSKKKYKRPSLNTADSEKYHAQLLAIMATEKPYLQANLSLRELAQKMDIHPNNLSELLNEKMGKNFSGYINHYRVEWFKKIAKDPKNAHISLLGLAYESGFNSKTAFNTFFKKAVGMTPKQYVKGL